jgi:drug/metabolite transporter (DMT)-like permease
MHPPRLIVPILAFAVVAFNAGGNFFLSVGMRSLGATVSLSPLAYLAALLNPWVALGVLFLAAWLISQLSLLSWADLTYVLPITSVTYVVTAVLAAVALHEHVSGTRWTGIALIFLGVLVAGRTRPRTVRAQVDK